MEGGSLTLAIIGYTIGVPLLLILLFSKRFRGRPLHWGWGVVFLLSVLLIAANIMHVIFKMRTR